MNIKSSLKEDTFIWKVIISISCLSSFLLNCHLGKFFESLKLFSLFSAGSNAQTYGKSSTKWIIHKLYCGNRAAIFWIKIVIMIQNVILKKYMFALLVCRAALFRQNFVIIYCTNMASALKTYFFKFLLYGKLIKSFSINQTILK